MESLDPQDVRAAHRHLCLTKRFGADDPTDAKACSKS